MAAAGVPKLAEPAARSFIAVAVACYFFDLYQQTRDHLTNGAGRPFGDDFINFWSGAFLAWHGRASEIYNVVAFHSFQQTVAGASLDGYHYSYPPVLLLLSLPFAFIPYLPALPLWLIGGWYAFYRVLRSAMREGGALLLALATPAVFINALGGQNGTWTAALLGGGLCVLERRPILAGTLFGLMAYKPQLGILIPFALLAGRHWRAFAAAAVMTSATSPCCAGRSWRMVSAYGTGSCRSLSPRRTGASVEVAYLIQVRAVVLAAAAVTVIWLRNTPAGIKNAVVCRWWPRRWQRPPDFRSGPCS